MELEGFASQALEMVTWLFTLINTGIIFIAEFLSRYLFFPADNIYLLLLGVISLWISSKFSTERDLKFFIIAAVIFILLFLNKGGVI